MGEWSIAPPFSTSDVSGQLHVSGSAWIIGFLFPQSRFGWCGEKNLLSVTGIDPEAVHPVAFRYADWATSA
jgi:hypothetical protein